MGKYDKDICELRVQIALVKKTVEIQQLMLG
jgi:hypothetical protein